MTLKIWRHAVFEYKIFKEFFETEYICAIIASCAHYVLIKI